MRGALCRPARRAAACPASACSRVCAAVSRRRRGRLGTRVGCLSALGEEPPRRGVILGVAARARAWWSMPTAKKKETRKNSALSHGCMAIYNQF